MPRQLALNPLPWILDTTFHLDVPSLHAGFVAARAAGFRAVQADVPPTMTTVEYRRFVSDHALVSAPGYFGSPVQDPHTLPSEVERARRHAALHAELGLQVCFLASDLTAERQATPAIGVPTGEASAVLPAIGALAEAMVAEGVYPILHPHVGTAIETEAETREVMDGVDSAVLGFGPDTGHLAWAGIDPVHIMGDYLDRIRGVHVKDVDREAARRAAAMNADYFESTQNHHVWTEPGRGVVDFGAILELLTRAEALEWFVVEVDVPNLPSAVESTLASADWARSSHHLRDLIDS